MYCCAYTTRYLTAILALALMVFSPGRSRAAIFAYPNTAAQDTIRTSRIDSCLTADTIRIERPVTDTIRIEQPVADTIRIDSAPQDTICTSFPALALRTNLLLPLLNVGIEIPIAEHWSLGIDYYYPWIWPAERNKDCFELLFFSAEARYWFNSGRNQELPDHNYLTGHSLGVYGSWGYYDFERNWHGYQGDVMSAGVDYLYALPVSKGRMRMEFELALGAIWSDHAQPYNVYVEGGRLIREPGHLKNFSYFGPTRLAVSLVVPIFRKEKTTNTK